MKKILIIGGTGMLRDTTDYFISNNFRVSVIGRDMQRLNLFAIKYPNLKTIHVISQDYRDTSKFIETIEMNIKKYGVFDIIICWIHSNAITSLLELINVLEKHNNKSIFYHVKGSSFYSATKNNLFNNMSLKKKLDYREIFLGFKVENGFSRWLTNKEISVGLIDAVNSNKTKFIIGQIEPLELLP